jgi:hypothetical protein
MTVSSGHFKFRRHDSIGANDAEDDDSFLNACFQDTGDVDVLLNCSNPKKIVLGRTGAGKTALLKELGKRSDRVIYVDPEHLSFNYLTNSTILPFLHELGVNLDPFYKLLWRHVFAVTIIQAKYGITNAAAQQNAIQTLLSFFESRETKDARKMQAQRREKALEYIRKWNDRFFEDIEHRTKELVHRFQEEVKTGIDANLRARLSGSIPGVGKGEVDAELSEKTGQSRTFGVEEKQEVINRARTVVNSIQVQQLGGIIDLLEEVLDDPQKPFIIAIDKLDEPWADNDLRMKLLKGLLDTVKEFGKVHNAKIVICLRIDLLEQLFRAARTESGFQEDKYRSLYLPLKWSKDNLEQLLNKRLQKLIRDSFTTYQPILTDVLPETIKIGRRKETKTLDYILERTWERPRDAIEFLNACIKKSDAKPTIRKTALLEAEGEYSRTRLRSIAQEWHAHYPRLPDCVNALLDRMTPQFNVGSIDRERIKDWALQHVCTIAETGDELTEIATKVTNSVDYLEEGSHRLASILYKTGCVGLKTASFSQTQWADSDSYTISSAEIKDDCVVNVHPGLWRVLGIEPA